MPPAAFQRKNVHQCMREIPATHAAVTRSTEKKRARKIVFPPCRSKKRSAHGSVRLLQVSRVPEKRIGTAGRVVAYADQEMERLEAEGRDYLEGVGARIAPVPSETIVRFGEPSAEILVEADAFGADMIVLTTGRQGWFKRATGGGLGERILRVAPVPVLLVRAA